jgi:type I site-specific restriction-modification system R (restriction) subunit
MKNKFNSNLLKVSENEELNKAIKEWGCIHTEKRDELDCVCICQRKVKNVTYMYNTKTKNTIIVGSVCFKKFKFQKNIIKNKILRKILYKNITQNLYEYINNMKEYCQSVEDSLLEYITNKYNKYKSNAIITRNYTQLIEFRDAIDDLIQNYDIEYLKNIYDKISNKINKMRQQDKDLIEKQNKDLKEQEEKQKKDLKEQEEKKYNDNLEKQLKQQIELDKCAKRNKEKNKKQAEQEEKEYDDNLQKFYDENPEKYIGYFGRGR